MKFHTKPLVQAVSLALLSLSVPTISSAQQADTQAKDDAIVPSVQVTGIRASLQASIASKKNADTNVEVLTADDVGKMPDKNIADALSRLTGVNVQYGGGGAFDEAERLAIRGTPPSLNLITMNSHALSSGDWHVGDQGGGRSVGFGLMPSQVLGRAVVYKTGQADLTEGGLAGTVDIQTRNPLDFKQKLTGELTAGMVYAQLAKKTDPQLSGLVNWKNEDNTLGILLQAYKEDRHLRRDGQEGFGYTTISDAAAALAGDASLSGKRLPSFFNTAEFEGERLRSGGFAAIQFKPSKDLELTATGFSSKLKANNYNSSGYGYMGAQLASGAKLTNYTVSGDVITSGTIVNPVGKTGIQAFEFDHIVRDGAESSSKFYDLDAKFRVSPALNFKGKIGYTKGVGVTQSQPTAQYGIYDKTTTFKMNGPDTAADWSVLGTNLNNLYNGDYKLSTAGAAYAKSVDDQSYVNLDGEFKLGAGGFSVLKFGVRLNNAERDFQSIAGRFNNLDALTTGCPAGSPAGTLCNMPSSQWAVPTTSNGDFGPNLGGNFPRDLFRYNIDSLSAWGKANMNWDPVLNYNPTSSFNVQEKTKAVYLMQEFDFADVSGNVGVRAVRTAEHSLSHQFVPTALCASYAPPAAPIPCSVPGSVNTRRGQAFISQIVEHSYDDFLPSLNVRWAATSDLITRFSVAKTLARADFSQLAGSTSLDDKLLTGSGGNPNLKPITSVNLDASVAYYMSPRSYVSFDLFNQDIKNYVKAGQSNVQLYNVTFNRYDTYNLTSRYGVDAKLRGAELAAELPIGMGFGVVSNATYVSAKDADGVRMLGTSDWTYNLRGYYETDKVTASLAWNYRTAYPTSFIGNGSGVNVPAAGIASGVRTGQIYYAAQGSLSLSASYKINENWSINLDGNNLLNPIRHTYYISDNAVSNFYENGRQFFLTLRAKI
ncbi:MAG: TonB-dependent receptor [Pseudomonadota bacterium]